MFTVFGYSITIERFIFIWFLVAAAGIAWFLLSVLIKVSRQVRQIDGRKLTGNVSSMASRAASTTETITSEYRPAIESGLGKTKIWLAPHFSFEGTSTRQQFILTQVIAGVLLGLVLGIGGSMYASESSFIHLLGIASIVAAICSASWVFWAVSAKRVRDTGITVWWVLTLLVPPLNLATFVFLLLVPSNEFQGRGL